MQTEKPTDGMGSGTIEDDNEVIEIEDSIHDDISEAYDELSLSEKTEEEPEEVSTEESSLEDDLQAAIKELSSEKEEETTPEVAKVEVELNKSTLKEVEIKAPQRFTAEEKEIFNKLPLEIKQIAEKAFKEQEADYTRSKQFLADGMKQLEAERAQNAELTKTMNRYLAKWGANGIAPEQGIMALAAAHDELTHMDKNVRKTAYAKLLINSGLDANDFAEVLGGQSQTQVQPQKIQQPILTEEERMRQSYVDSLIARDQALQQQTQEQQVLSVIKEIEAVKEEKDATGRYIYPKLHDATFIDKVKPLVLATMETTGVSWGEAFKKVYAIAVPDFQSGQTRFPTQNNNRSNAVNVTRSSPTIRSNGQPIDQPEWGAEKDGLSLEDDIKASLELLKRGGSGQY